MAQLHQIFQFPEFLFQERNGTLVLLHHSFEPMDLTFEAGCLGLGGGGELALNALQLSLKRGDGLSVLLDLRFQTLGPLVDPGRGLGHDPHEETDP